MDYNVWITIEKIEQDNEDEGVDTFTFKLDKFSTEKEAQEYVEGILEQFSTQKGDISMSDDDTFDEIYIDFLDFLTKIKSEMYYPSGGFRKEEILDNNINVMEMRLNENI